MVWPLPSLPPPSPLHNEKNKLRYTMSSSRIEYSEKYADEENEYRWVYIKPHVATTQPIYVLLDDDSMYATIHDSGRTAQFNALAILRPLSSRFLCMVFAGSAQTN